MEKLNIDNIYKERRLEPATKGYTFYDLVCQGRTPFLLASKGFVAGKHEVLPIPLSELSILNWFRMRY